jgi:ferritin-like protein
MEGGLQSTSGMASEGLHESADQLKPDTRDMHRAIVSLMEELEAVDWYGQRVDATGDAELRAILAHNRAEEQEHAAMVLEWIRRHDAGFDRHLRAYLFTQGSIAGREAAAETQGAGGSGNGARPPTTVGSLRENR